jgi:hypothetical protein
LGKKRKSLPLQKNSMCKFGSIRIKECKTVQRFYIGIRIAFYKVNPRSDPVPEPASMLLVGFGLMGLAGYGKKKFF